VDGQARKLIEAFRARYGGQAPPRLWRAPGRVNLIGEHTDYNLGFVLPIALELACWVAAAPAEGSLVRVYSANTGEERAWPAARVLELEPAGDWGDYVAGVAVELARAGYEIRPANLFIDSTVPFGGGLSSSAALEVATALALLDGRRIEPLELARLARRAENQFAGMPCGIMDQYVAVFGRQGCALKIDCRSLTSEPVPLPGEVAIVAVNSMVKHALGATAYRDRVEECRRAVEAIRHRHPEVESLRDARPEHLELVDGVARQRARHVISENRRVEEFVAACQARDLVTMGTLFVASHRSLARDYEVSCQELDFLVEAALAIPGVYGSRMTGGGFGGCTVTLVAPGELARFEESISAAYRSRFGIEPRLYRCEPSAGAAQVSESGELLKTAISM
jgi:galactokinase